MTMQTLRRRTAVRLAVLAGLVGAGGTLAALTQPRVAAGQPVSYVLTGAGLAAGSRSRTTDGVAAGTAAGFRIRGSVSGLYPGANRPLKLTVSNPQTFAIDVTSVTTTVTGATTGCTTSNLVVASFHGNLIAPAHGAASVTVTATMLHSAPDGCQGALFTLGYTGSAVNG